jgi:hypothetical protein
LRELQAADPSTRTCSAPNAKQSRTRRSHSQVAVFEKLPQAASAQIYQICLPELISARILTAVQNGGYLKSFVHNAWQAAVSAA